MITSSITIQASVQEIWDALTQQDRMTEWYFYIPDFELKVGAAFNFFEHGYTMEYHYRCVIKEIIPNKVFSHTWTYPSKSKGESLITWTLEEQEKGTLVTLTHVGAESFIDIGPEFTPKNYKFSWDEFLLILRDHCCEVKTRIYTIEINATAEWVWSALFDVKNYKQWTAVFCASPYFKSELEERSGIHVLNSKVEEMLSNVFYIDYPKTLYTQSEEVVQNYGKLGVSATVPNFGGPFERYLLVEKGNSIKLMVEIGVTEDHLSYFDEHFPKGLEIVKTLAENK